TGVYPLAAPLLLSSVFIGPASWPWPNRLLDRHRLPRGLIGPTVARTVTTRGDDGVSALSFCAHFPQGPARGLRGSRRMLAAAEVVSGSGICSHSPKPRRSGREGRLHTRSPRGGIA